MRRSSPVCPRLFLRRRHPFSGVVLSASSLLRRRHSSDGVPCSTVNRDIGVGIIIGGLPVGVSANGVFPVAPSTLVASSLASVLSCLSRLSHRTGC